MASAFTRAERAAHSDAPFERGIQREYRRPSGNSEPALAYARKARVRFVRDLAKFVRFPSVSAQPQHAKDLRHCAAWLAGHLRAIGLEHVRVIHAPGHPIVTADWLRARRSATLLIYGHYDVQPADSLGEWVSPPFEPAIRGDNLYGRGASDDKGQMFVHVKALESYLRTSGSLPINVKCLFEGEEEIGSPHLGSFVRSSAAALAADVAVLSDTSILGPCRPAITELLRGSLSVELTVRGQEHDLHSGSFGGAIHNPLQVLADIVAKLHDPGGAVAIPGFYDRVRALSGDERCYMASFGPSDAQILRDGKAAGGWGEPGFTLYERTTIRPALIVNGITGGYQGPGAKAVIPARGSAKLNFRLVPDQDPKEIGRLFQDFVARITPPTVHIGICTQISVPPVIISRDHPAVGAAAAAYRKSFGVAPVFRREGGTIPAPQLLQDRLGFPPC